MSSLFRYSVADTPFSVPSNVTTDELCDLINGLLKAGKVECRQFLSDNVPDTKMSESLNENVFPLIPLFIYQLAVLADPIIILYK